MTTTTSDDHDRRWNDQDAALIDTLHDVMLPESDDGALPAGGQLGVRRYLSERIEDTPGLRAAIDAVLGATRQQLADRGSESLAALPMDEQIACVRAVEAADPQAFLRFSMHTNLGYYCQPSIPPHFGMPDRPPQPLGHTLPEDDLEAMLQPVRERGKVYLDC